MNDQVLTSTVASLAAIIVIGIVFLALAVRVVKEDERMVVFRLGRTNAELVRQPGLRFIIPFVDRPVRVDMRSQVAKVSSPSTATRDKELVDLDARIGYRVTDPLAMVLSVSDLRGSLETRGMVILLDLIGESSNDDVRFRRDRLAVDMQDRLEAETEPWGVTVSEVTLS